MCIGVCKYDLLIGDDCKKMKIIRSCLLLGSITPSAKGDPDFSLRNMYWVENISELQGMSRRDISCCCRILKTCFSSLIHLLLFCFYSEVRQETFLRNENTGNKNIILPVKCPYRTANFHYLFFWPGHHACVFLLKIFSIFCSFRNI